MKNEVGTPVIIAVIVIALLVVGGIAYTVFGKKSGGGNLSQSDKDQIIKEHPEAAAAFNTHLPGSGGSEASKHTRPSGSGSGMPATGGSPGSAGH